VPISGDLSVFEETTVGIVTFSQVPLATRWTTAIIDCVTEGGGKIDARDLGSDLSRLPGVLSAWNTLGRSAVFVIGADLTDQTDALAPLVEAETPIVTWNAGVPQLGVSLDSDHYNDGRLAARAVLSRLPNGGTVLLVTASNPALDLRAKGVRDVLTEVAGIRLVEGGDPNGFTDASAKTAAAALLAAEPTANAIIAGFGLTGVQAAAAVIEASSSAFVVSINGDPDELAAVRAGGPLVATVSNAQEAGGWAACQIAASMIGGEPSPVTAGSVLLGESVVVDSTNVEAQTTPEALRARSFYVSTS